MDSAGARNPAKRSIEEVEVITKRNSAVLTSIVVLCWAAVAVAQGPPQQPQRPKTAREGTQADLVGYWVPLITEDWLYRVITPAKGDTTSVPLNPEGKKVANAWDLAKDEASGEQCKPFGAPGLMR